MLYFIFINQCTFDIIGILISKLNKINKLNKKRNKLNKKKYKNQIKNK